MAINLGSKESGDLVENADINITPFIDVILVLLILLMVAAPLSTVDVAVDLRAQITDPNRDGAAFDDAELQAIPERVSLPNLAACYGGFSARCDWSRFLSPGERQRIAFARILASKARYVFLDAATSALDNATERLLYTGVREMGCTFISVAQRSSVFPYHDTVLHLTSEGWEVHPIDQDGVDARPAPFLSRPELDPVGS